MHLPLGSQQIFLSKENAGSKITFSFFETSYEDLSEELQSSNENFTLHLLYGKWGQTGETEFQKMAPSYKEITFNQNWMSPVSNPTDALGQASEPNLAWRCLVIFSGFKVAK